MPGTHFKTLSIVEATFQTKVLDSWALMAFFNDEPSAEEAEKLLVKASEDKHKLLLSVVNWGEIYYSVMRGGSQELAEQKAQEIASLPIELVTGGQEFKEVEKEIKINRLK